MNSRLPEFLAHLPRLILSPNKMNVPEADVDNNEDVLANNSLLELFVSYFWSNYLFQPEEDRRRLINWLISKSSTGGNRIERNLKLSLECVLAFLSKSHDDPTYTDENGQTIFHILFSNYVHSENDLPKESAADQMRRDCQVTKNLINVGASIITADRFGNTPLGMAVSKNRRDIVQSVPQHTRNANAFYSQNKFLKTNNTRNRLGETALHIVTKSYAKRRNDPKDHVKYERIIRDFVLRGADFSIVDINGMTPVHYAAMKCYPLALMSFSDYGADFNLKTKIGDNLLILACKNITMVDYIAAISSTIDYLLNQGYDVNHRNRGGHTALHYAAQSRQKSIVAKLIESGANVNVVGLDGTTPLHSAIMLSNHHVVRYLIEHGVDAKVEEKEFGFTMVHLAALNHDKSLFDLFAKRAFGLNKSSKDGLTPLHLAAMSANTEVVKELIDSEFDVNCRDDIWQFTPLHFASMRGQLRSFDEMNVPGCEEQLDMNQLNLIKHCFSRLKFKIDAEIDYKPVINLLLKAGAEVNAKDARGWTPLHCAVQQSEPDIVEVLLKAGADVDALDNDGRGPLQNAMSAMENNWRVIEYLLKYGANIEDVESIVKDIYDKSKIPKFMIADRLLRHAAKLECARLQFGHFYKPQRKKARIEGFKVKYLQEIHKMKKRMLTDKVSLYDMLHLTSKQRASFVDRLPCDIEAKLYFPDCGIVFYARCHEAVNREWMLESAKLACNLLAQVHWPELCVECIFSFLRNRDLRALIDSAVGLSF